MHTADKPGKVRMKEGNQEKIDKVEQAQDKLKEAIEILEEAVGDDGHTRAYLIDQIKTLTSSDHEFLCGDFNCDKLMEQLREDDDDDEDHMGEGHTGDGGY